MSRPPATQTMPSRRLGGLLATAAVASVAAVAVIGSGTAASPRVVGDPVAGKALFATTCGVCHVLKAAGTVGTIGGNLDRVDLSEATIVKAITDGGAGVMTKAALAGYPTRMTGYDGTLSTVQIDDIAAFEYLSTHATAASTATPSITSFRPASGKAGATVTIAGAGLSGVEAVKIGAVKAAFKAVSAKRVTVTVPVGAKSGKITILTPGGKATSPTAFTVTA
jgi:mono/diheme cytochrome c family protein